MKSLTVVIAVDTVPVSIATLAALASAIPTLDTTGLRKILNNVAWFRIYAESTNDVDATNGPARIGFDNQVSRVVATQHGEILLPGVPDGKLFMPGGGGSQLYNFGLTFLSGKAGDQFQLSYGQV